MLDILVKTATSSSGADQVITKAHAQWSLKGRKTKLGYFDSCASACISDLFVYMCSVPDILKLALLAFNSN